jgi:hypothetical protein
MAIQLYKTLDGYVVDMQVSELHNTQYTEISHIVVRNYKEEMAHFHFFMRAINCWNNWVGNDRQPYTVVFFSSNEWILKMDG